MARNSHGPFTSMNVEGRIEQQSSFMTLDGS